MSQGLATLLQVEAVGPDCFEGRADAAAPGRLFGGHTAGQALVAAGRSVVSDRTPHAVKVDFVGPGRPDAPITYEVERVRDGGAFTTRAVRARQEGRLLLLLTASFHRAEVGPQDTVLAPAVAPPEQSIPLAEWWSRTGADVTYGYTPAFGGDVPVEIRVADAADETATRGRARFDVWMRPLGAMPDSDLVHAAALTYMADTTMGTTATVTDAPISAEPLGVSASLDHHLWFHRPARVDTWVRFRQQRRVRWGGRALVRGEFHDLEGVLVASAAQEGLFRPLSER